MVEVSSSFFSFSSVSSAVSRSTCAAEADFAKRHNDNTPSRRSTTTAPKRHNDITTPKRHNDNAEPVKAAAQKTLRCDSETPDFLAAFRACARGRACV
jgi:hypothetical protein